MQYPLVEPFAPKLMTREQGLARLSAALPSLGRRYAEQRNTVPRPDEDPTTSTLSPWLRRRLLSEEAVIDAATSEHGAAGARKFVQEVYWRTYFKGNLEQHPSVWTHYLEGVARARSIAGRHRNLESAEQGRTGIECFDSWNQELRETGWLHNHVRMWFASIWIFTLGLPWELGADFFARELIDFDPASNTLSWRWVAGLHTRGKNYIARAENIARYTQGRFNPAGQINESAQSLTEPALPAHVALPEQDTLPAGPCCLLVHEEDLNPETLELPRGIAKAAVIRIFPDGAKRRHDATKVACDDARDRVSSWLNQEATILDGVDGSADWAAGMPIVTPYAPVGPIATLLRSVTATRVIRPWDAKWWPYCDRGFFKLRGRLDV